MAASLSFSALILACLGDDREVHRSIGGWVGGSTSRVDRSEGRTRGHPERPSLAPHARPPRGALDQIQAGLKTSRTSKGAKSASPSALAMVRVWW